MSENKTEYCPTCRGVRNVISSEEKQVNGVVAKIIKIHCEMCNTFIRDKYILEEEEKKDGGKED